MDRYTMSKDELLQELLWLTRFGQTEWALETDEYILDILEYYLDSYIATLVPYKKPIDHLLEATRNFINELDNYTKSDNGLDNYTEPNNDLIMYRLLDTKDPDKDGLKEFFKKYNITEF